MHRNIGIVGRKRSGKDTAADLLVREFGYVRHGLADPLKEAALALDPIITLTDVWGDDYHVETTPGRLSEIIEEIGWEVAKDRFPEVRRILQKLGDEAGRQVHGELTWINQLLRRTIAANEAGHPVVVPDVRYPNEADVLREAGFLVVRIDRPGFSTPTPGEHASEQVERLEVDVVLTNGGTIEDMWRSVRDLTR